MTLSSFFEHMGYLVAIALVLPTVFGIVAKVAVFERDEDDAARDDLEKSDQIRRLREGPVKTREPDPVYEAPWQNFDSTRPD